MSHNCQASFLLSSWCWSSNWKPDACKSNSRSTVLYHKISLSIPKNDSRLTVPWYLGLLRLKLSTWFINSAKLGLCNPKVCWCLSILPYYFSLSSPFLDNFLNAQFLVLDPLMCFPLPTWIPGTDQENFNTCKKSKHCCLVYLIQPLHMTRIPVLFSVFAHELFMVFIGSYLERKQRTQRRLFWSAASQAPNEGLCFLCSCIYYKLATIHKTRKQAKYISA